jgi:hypothetical protein
MQSAHCRTQEGVTETTKRSSVSAACDHLFINAAQVCPYAGRRLAGDRTAPAAAILAAADTHSTCACSTRTSTSKQRAVAPMHSHRSPQCPCRGAEHRPRPSSRLSPCGLTMLGELVRGPTGSQAPPPARLLHGAAPRLNSTVHPQCLTLADAFSAPMAAWSAGAARAGWRAGRLSLAGAATCSCPTAARRARTTPSGRQDSPAGPG